MNQSPTIPCDLCKGESAPAMYLDPACGDRPVCEECRDDLNDARNTLNRNGMVNIYTGPCPDNDTATP